MDVKLQMFYILALHKHWPTGHLHAPSISPSELQLEHQARTACEVVSLVRCRQGSKTIH